MTPDLPQSAPQPTSLMTAKGTLELPAHVDVLVVGAGLSGIGVACHLTTNQPGRTLAIIDGREQIGGTWDLFRYPGIRSDSDLHTFGYEFKPWMSRNAIADGHEILAYLEETIADYGLAPHIYLGHRVTGAHFSTETGRWTVTLQRLSDHKTATMTCG
jgi:monooxygenase